MEQEKKQAVALMRYSAIAPLITGTQEDYESLSAYFRTASAKGIKAPDGSIRHYSPGTLEKWYLHYINYCKVNTIYFNHHNVTNSHKNW